MNRSITGLIHPALAVVFCVASTASVAAAQAALAKHTVAAGGQALALWEKRAPNPKGTIVLLHGRTWSSLPDFDLQVPGEHRSLMDALVARQVPKCPEPSIRFARRQQVHGLAPCLTRWGQFRARNRSVPTALNSPQASLAAHPTDPHLYSKRSLLTKC